MTRRSPATAAILAAFDQGQAPSAISKAGYTRDLVYKVLRRDRPNRARAKRVVTSPTAALVAALRASGVSVARVAALLRITPQAVYKATSSKPLPKALTIRN